MGIRGLSGVGEKRGVRFAFRRAFNRPAEASIEGNAQGQVEESCEFKGE
tara:strand:- start:9812 stop:9958 length:147 start_codon:yes stop_codon:yes gene_type:complete